jgi:hypothetical protein
MRSFRNHFFTISQSSALLDHAVQVCHDVRATHVSVHKDHNNVCVCSPWFQPFKVLCDVVSVRHDKPNAVFVSDVQRHKGHHRVLIDCYENVDRMYVCSHIDMGRGETHYTQHFGTLADGDSGSHIYTYIYIYICVCVYIYIHT